MDWFYQDPAFFTNMGVIVVMFFAFYFMIIRPQKKEERKRETFQSSLKKGDKVVTAGGMYGVIVAIGEQRATLRVAEKIEIEFTRSAVVRFQDPSKQELLEEQTKAK